MLKLALRYLLLAAAARLSPPAPAAPTSAVSAPAQPPQPASTLLPLVPPQTSPAGRRERIVEGAVGNGIGTVLAAPVVYLGATAAGLVRADPRPVLVALAPLSVAAGVLLGRAWVRSSRPPVWPVLALLVLLGLIALGAPLGSRALSSSAVALLVEGREALNRSDLAVSAAKTLASEARLRWSLALSVVGSSVLCLLGTTMATALVLGRGRLHPSAPMSVPRAARWLLAVGCPLGLLLSLWLLVSTALQYPEPWPPLPPLP